MTAVIDPPRSLDELVERYYRAYNERDLEGILALQTPDAEYRLHGVHETRTFKGADACREVYEHHLRAWPDQRLELHTVMVGGDVCACHLWVTGTLVVPWRMAGRTYEPTGRPITFEIAHVMRCESNLVRTKDGWIDAYTIHRQLAGAAAQ